MNINHQTAQAIHNIVDYMWDDEKRSFEESKEEGEEATEDHIFNYVRSLHNVWESLTTEYILIVDCDERGEFAAHVEPLLEEGEGVEIYEYGNRNEKQIIELEMLMDEGWMSHTTDVKGLLKFLTENQYVPPNATLICRE